MSLKDAVFVTAKQTQ